MVTFDHVDFVFHIVAPEKSSLFKQILGDYFVAIENKHDIKLFKLKIIFLSYSFGTILLNYMRESKHKMNFNLLILSSKISPKVALQVSLAQIRLGVQDLGRVAHCD